ncbi:MAG TPA: GldG family protein [Devosiaceae bacterium]|nr:GldG family protein [Devosiaceae bacterium]
MDLTEEQIYSVSPSTRQVLASVSEPITLRLYLSSALIEQAPELRVYADRVTELLRTYEQLSAGRVQIEQVDPVPFSTDEDRAIGYNLVGFNISRAAEQGYFGLVGTNSVDQLELIAVLTPAREAYLEYDLTRMVLRLARPTEPRIGVIDGLGMFGSMVAGRQPSVLIDRLGDDFELVQIAQGATAIPEDIDALMIVHPHSLTAPALYAVDQYALRGGPTLVFVDPLAEHGTPSPNNRAVPEFPNSSLEPMMAAWGVSMPPGFIVGDLNMALEIRGQAGNQSVVSDYPPWLIVDRDNLNPDDIVTNQLVLMRISSAGPLRAVEGATTTFTPLIQTTSDTMLYERATVMRREDPRTLVNSFVSSGLTETLAARVTGPARTAFPDGPPPPSGDAPPAEAGQPGDQVFESDGPINVIIVSDSDMLADDLNVNARGAAVTQNAAFVINALDSAMGGGELIGLRGRGLSFRPFTLVDEIEKAADARYRATEQQLETELEETQSRLDELRLQAATPDGESGVLTREQQDTVAEFNQRLVEVRKELREVRAALREEIDSLSNWLRLLNILAVPAVLIVIGAVVAIWRRTRLSRYLRGRRAGSRA